MNVLRKAPPAVQKSVRVVPARDLQWHDGGAKLTAVLRPRPEAVPGWVPLEDVIMMLKMSTRLLDGIPVLDCSGRIVIGDESAALRETVKKLLSENQRLVLNLGEVNYIDSAGLGTLVSLYTSAKNSGAGIKLANLTQRVGDLLQVTKLLTVFDVYDGEDQAIRAFRRGMAA